MWAGVGVVQPGCAGSLWWEDSEQINLVEALENFPGDTSPVLKE